MSNTPNHELKAIVENGRTVRIVGKRIASTPEEDAAEMRRVWSPTPQKKTRTKNNKTQSGIIFGHTWAEIEAKQQKKRL